MPEIYPNVTQTQLDNGLTVFLKEIHTAPLISHWVWYRVGSRNELPGMTGISHWVEHMQFKGTQRYPGGVLDKAIARYGGVWNAFTYLDWTAYYETLPADRIDLAIQLEADRMSGSRFVPEDVEGERTVILSEREGSENEPLFRLDEAMQQKAFDRHPYRNEVIGSTADLWKIQRDDLYGHYRSHYLPNNAVLSMAGDFDTQEMIDRLAQTYGSVPAGEVERHEVEPEAPLTAERRVEVEGPGETAYLKAVYRAPAASDPDFFAFTILDSLLAGPASLNMFGGGGISNKTSRFYRALVERELAVGISGGLQATLDPYLYTITATVHPRQTPEAVLTALDVELNRVCQEQVSPAEIARATKQARALFAYGSENITNQAFWMGYSEMFAHYDWFVEYVQRLEPVRAEDVLRVARQYLNPARRVVGVYRPNGETLAEPDFDTEDGEA
jgi:zinc protease